ncbi:MAG: hypothetical protein R2684_16730 [Pyrinomonadaceae bacterium]
MSEKRNYKLYGLSISSDRKIELLEECESTSTDVVVEWVPSLPEEALDSFRWERVSTDLLDLVDEIALFESPSDSGLQTRLDINTPTGGKLRIIVAADRSKAKIQFDPEIAASDLDSYFVGPIMSFILRLSGVVSLHASAVVVDEVAIAFVGSSTSGKSTLAAGMARTGSLVLADDIAAIREVGNRFEVSPGYTRVRLRPGAAAHLTGGIEGLDRVYGHRDSFYYSENSDEMFAGRSFPLGAVYLLGSVGIEYRIPRVEAVEGREKLLKLVENASGLYFVRGDMRTNEFGVLSKLAARIPIRRLFHAHEIDTLDAQCEIIRSDIRKIIDSQ